MRARSHAAFANELLRRDEIVVEPTSRIAVGTFEQVPVAVERDRDARTRCSFPCYSGISTEGEGFEPSNDESAVNGFRDPAETA